MTFWTQPKPGNAPILWGELSFDNCPQPVFAFLTVFCIATGLYLRVLIKLVSDWWSDANYSHAFVIPLFAGFVLWERRKKLARIPLRPSWWGLAISVLALVLLVLGVLGAELFLARISLLILLAGVIVLFFGLECFRAVLFPWASLILAVPIPAIVFNQITLPLQLFASEFATYLLSMCGVPVLRDGNILHLPSTTLEVVAACSGVRSLVSLISLATFYGYVRRRTLRRRLALVALSIPIAVGTNSLRVMGTGLLAEYWNADKAQGFFHTFAGLVVFSSSMLLLILIDLIARRMGKSSPQQI
jgi:exosortase